jgi:hypothetical protein
MSSLILPGKAPAYITALLLDEGGRAVTLVDVTEDITRIMLPANPIDEIVEENFAHNHRPKMGKRRHFEWRGKEFRLQHSGLVIRPFWQYQPG